MAAATPSLMTMSQKEKSKGQWARVFLFRRFGLFIQGHPLKDFCLCLTDLKDVVWPPSYTRGWKTRGPREKVGDWVWVNQPTISATIPPLWSFAHYRSLVCMTPTMPPISVPKVSIYIHYMIIFLRAVGVPSFLVWCLCNPSLVNTLISVGFHPSVCKPYYSWMIKIMQITTCLLSVRSLRHQLVLIWPVWFFTILEFLILFLVQVPFSSCGDKLLKY